MSVYRDYLRLLKQSDREEDVAQCSAIEHYRELLKAHGAEASHYNIHNKLAFECAAALHKEEKERNEEALREAYRAKNYEEMKRLLSEGVSPHIYLTEPATIDYDDESIYFEYGCMRCDVSYNYESGKNISTLREEMHEDNRKRLLLFHAHCYDETALQLLLDFGADPRIIGKSMTTIFDPSEDSKIVRNYVPNVTDALESDDLAEFKKYYEANRESIKLPYLLASAIEHSGRNIIEYIIDLGVDIKEEVFGATYLQHALNHGNIPAVEVLLDKGADVDERDEYKNTPLMKAIVAEKCDVARVLIEYGADVNALDKSRNTPLHLIASKRVLSSALIHVARLLIEKGADTTKKNASRKTAQQLHGDERFQSLF